MANTHQLQFLHRLACLAAISVMLVGALVLFGWVNDIPALYRVAKDLPPMTPSTALSFLLTGVALLLLQPEHISPLRRRMGQVLAVGGLLMGLLLLLSYVHWLPNTILDQLLMFLGLFELSPLKSSPDTAVAFILASMGLAFLSNNQSRLVNIAQWVAFLSSMALVVVFLGYAHQEDMFHVFFGHRGMALHTATALTLLGWGIILAKVEKGFGRIMASDTAGGVVARRVILLIALFPPLLGWLPVLLQSSRLSLIQVESLLAALMIVTIVIIVIRLAYRLDREETLRGLAQEEARQHQADLAHVVRLNTMGEMASGIAHELNQPLAAMANYARACQRMIQSGEEPQRLQEPLAAIHKQAMRASEIIRHLRTLVRKQPPQKVSACLEQVIHEALQLTKTSAKKHHVPLLLELDDAVPDIKIDIIQIQQVILNIVQNAIDAMRETESHRRQVLVRSYLTPEGMVQVDISDTGPGIAAELKPRVFDAFVTTKGNSGMGIGLSLCRSIIEAHGGNLWVKSVPEQGATFSFTLPVD